MAIQFNCPYCTAPIRVADSAGGKKGICPKCKTALIVPKPSAPPSPAPDESAKPQAAETAISEGAPEFGGIQTSAPGTAGGPSMAQLARRRAKRKGMNPLIPIAFFGVVIVVAVFVLWKPNEALEGRLTAQRLDDNDLPAGYVDKQWANLSKEDMDEVLRKLEDDPIPGSGVKGRMQFRYSLHPRGLELRVTKDASRDIVRVNPNVHPKLRAYLKEHRAALTATHSEELRMRTARFFEFLKEAQDQNQPFNTGAWRDALVSNAMVSGFGYHVQAVVDGKTYPCMHEDEEGGLFFLLPKNIEAFELNGRDVEGGTHFPGRFQVDVESPTPPVMKTPKSDDQA